VLFKRKTYHNLSDEELMRFLINDGDDRAFELLYDRYSGKLHSYFYRMLYQDQNKADDFTQDLFMKIVERPEMFDPNRRFSTWLYSVAGNMCKNEYRRNGRYQIVNEVPENPIPECFEYIPEPIDRALFEQQLQQAVNELEETQKQCFILRYQEGLSVKEIANVVDCPEGTVKSRLFYTVRKLSDKLKIFQYS
jgi:RNA polymerase sigma-70 factor (ECF subfamily)